MKYTIIFSKSDANAVDYYLKNKLKKNSEDFKNSTHPNKNEILSLTRLNDLLNSKKELITDYKKFMENYLTNLSLFETSYNGQNFYSHDTVNKSAFNTLSNGVISSSKTMTEEKGEKTTPQTPSLQEAKSATRSQALVNKEVPVASEELINKINFINLWFQKLILSSVTDLPVWHVVAAKSVPDNSNQSKESAAFICSENLNLISGHTEEITLQDSQEKRSNVFIVTAPQTSNVGLT